MAEKRIEGAAVAIQMANTNGLVALISALAESGSLDPSVFKRHVETIERIQKNNSKVNQEFYDAAMANLIAASEGRVK